MKARRVHHAFVAGVVASALLALASCTGGGGVAGVDVAPDSTKSSTPRPASTINDAAVASLRSAADLDPCPSLDPSGVAASDDSGLPDVALACLGGGPDVELGDLRGPVVVNLWASWCLQCADEAPYLAEVYADPDRTVGVIGLDYNDTAENGLRAAEALGMRYPSTWSDDNSLRAPLRIVGLPITLFIDSFGVEVGRKVGAITSTDELRSLITQYFGASG